MSSVLLSDGSQKLNTEVLKPCSILQNGNQRRTSVNCRWSYRSRSPRGSRQVRSGRSDFNERSCAARHFADQQWRHTHRRYRWSLSCDDYGWISVAWKSHSRLEIRYWAQCSRKHVHATAQNKKIVTFFELLTNARKRKTKVSVYSFTDRSISSVFSCRRIHVILFKIVLWPLFWSVSEVVISFWRTWD